MAQCPHGHSMPEDVIGRLGESQAGAARHKCAICAYGLGVLYSREPVTVEWCPHSNVAPVELLAGLPDYQGGPTRHLCATCAFTEGVAHGAGHVSIEVDANLETDGEDGALEGMASIRVHKAYERDGRNRSKAIIHHGNKCLGCGFFFDTVYTPQHANGYIEVHHVKPLAEGPQFVDPRRDLIPLCSNCHRMCHRRKGMSLTLDELRALLQSGGALGHTAI